MKKNIALVISWCLILALLVVSYFLLRGFMGQNEDLRLLRADVTRQQLSMRQKQVEIVKRLEGVDEGTRREVVDLLLETAIEIDELRDRNELGFGESELAELREALNMARPGNPAEGEQVRGDP